MIGLNPADRFVEVINSYHESRRKREIDSVADLLGSSKSDYAVRVLVGLARAPFHQKSNKIEIARAVIHAAKKPAARKHAGAVLHEVLDESGARSALIGAIRSYDRSFWSVSVLEHHAVMSARVLPGFLGEKDKRVQKVVKYALTRDNIAGHARQRLLAALADPNKRQMALEILQHPSHADYLPAAIHNLRQKNRNLAAMAARMLKLNAPRNKRK